MRMGDGNGEDVDGRGERERMGDGNRSQRRADDALAGGPAAPLRRQTE